MRTSRKYLPFLALFVALIFAGCEGDRGPVGPPGDLGDPGEQGPQGPQGPTGNANVQVVQFTLESDSLDRSQEGNTVSDTMQIGEVSGAVVTNGTVQAFVEQFPDGRIASNAAIRFEDQQRKNDTTVTVTSNFAPRSGFVAVHEANTNDEGDEVPGDVIGVSEFQEAGARGEFDVTLDQPLQDDQRLFAMAHEETNANQTFDFVTSEGADDTPFTRLGEPVTADAFVTGGTSFEAGTRRAAPEAGIAARLVNDNPNSDWTALPLRLMKDTNDDGERDSEIEVNYGATEGTLFVKFSSLNKDALNEENLDGVFNFKIVVIPPAEDGTSEKYEFDTFEEAAQQLGLTERHVVQLN